MPRGSSLEGVRAARDLCGRVEPRSSIARTLKAGGLSCRSGRRNAIHFGLDGDRVDRWNGGERRALKIVS